MKTKIFFKFLILVSKSQMSKKNTMDGETYTSINVHFSIYLCLSNLKHKKNLVIYCRAFEDYIFNLNINFVEGSI
jgi:hypothetical protein